MQYVGNLAWHQNIQRHINNLSPETGLQMVQVPNPDGEGGTVPVTLACLGGDSGNHYQTDNIPGNNTHDTACKAGFQQFPGGQNQFRQFQGYQDINQQENTTNGTYNGFQGGVRLQNKWGLSGEARLHVLT